MTLKEELLQKGIDPAIVEEMINLAESGKSGDAIEALAKALSNTGGQQDLFKADDEDDDDDDSMSDDDNDDDDDDDGYDEKYMKKNMKRYMSENKAACKKMVESFEGESGKLQKAISSIDEDADGAVVEMVNLSPLLTSISSTMQSLTKAMFKMIDRVDELESGQIETQDLLEKASSVTLAIAENNQKVFSQSTGRRSVTEDLTKAEISRQQTAQNSNKRVVHEVLKKAIQNGDRKAGEIMGVFESTGMRLDVLNSDEKLYVKNLLEAK